MLNSRLSHFKPGRILSEIGQNSGLFISLIIATALIFFEIFNFSTTDYALQDLLGDLRFAGFRWSTALSIAFCGIDFAGVARLFTPENDGREHQEVWYLFGAWILAATMNAALTWWGVSMAIVNHSVQSSAVLDTAVIIKVVPIFVAVMVWTIRILIIGAISVTGNRFLWGKSHRSSTARTASNSNDTQAQASIRSNPRSNHTYRN